MRRAARLAEDGLIGGMSWESTAVCYRRLNEQVLDRLGGLHSPAIPMRLVDFAGTLSLQKQGRWEACQILAGIARSLDRAGARCLLICINTMLRLSDEVRRAGTSALHVAVAVDFSMMKQPSHPRAA